MGLLSISKLVHLGGNACNVMCGRVKVKVVIGIVTFIHSFTS